MPGTKATTLPAVVLLLFASGEAWSGLDIDEYMPPIESNLTEEQRQRQQAAVQREIEEARQRAEEKARQEAEERRQREAERAARPYPVRLTETRCLGCHGMETLLEQRRTRLGWELVALRMQRFNGAHLEAGERAVIAAHLARTYPAPTQRKLAEPLVLILVVTLPVFLIWRWLRRLSVHR